MLVAELKAAGVRVRLDAQVATSFGRRATDWELKGVPVRIEVGPRDLAEGLVTVVPARHRREAAGDRVGRGRARRRRCSPRSRPTCSPPPPGAGTIAPSRWRRSRRPSRRPRSASRRSPGTCIKDGGEARLAQDAITVRCLQTRRRRPAPPARTSPTSSPTSPGATDPRQMLRRVFRRSISRRAWGPAGRPGRIPGLFRSFVGLERRGLRPAPLPCQEEVRDPMSSRGSRAGPRRCPCVAAADLDLYDLELDRRRAPGARRHARRRRHRRHQHAGPRHLPGARRARPDRRSLHPRGRHARASSARCARPTTSRGPSAPTVKVKTKPGVEGERRIEGTVTGRRRPRRSPCRAPTAPRAPCTTTTSSGPAPPSSGAAPRREEGEAMSKLASESSMQGLAHRPAAPLSTQPRTTDARTDR